MRTDTGKFFGDPVWAEIRVMSRDAWDLVSTENQHETENNVLMPSESSQESDTMPYPASQNAAGVEEADEREGGGYSCENPFLQDCIGVPEDTQDTHTTTEWAEAMTVLYDMGFEDEERMISALKQHATPATWQETEKMQA